MEVTGGRGGEADAGRIIGSHRQILVWAKFEFGQILSLSCRDFLVGGGIGGYRSAGRRLMGLGLGWEYPWLLREGALGMGQGRD
jgi:hypothetical protein